MQASGWLHWTTHNEWITWYKLSLL